MSTIYTENFGLKWDMEIGYRVIAPMNIPIGTLVLHEEPFMFSLCFEQDLIQTCHCCFNNNLPLKKCTKCGFTLYCSVECENYHRSHGHDLECEILSKNKLMLRLFLMKCEMSFIARIHWKLELMQKIGDINNNDLPFSIGIRDTIVPSENNLSFFNNNTIFSHHNHTFGDVLRLAHHCDKVGSKVPDFINLLASVLSNDLMTDKDEKSKIFSDASLSEELRRLTAYYSVNGFSINNEQGKCGFGLFPRAALFNHSCYPNCEVIFLPKTHAMEIRTVREVEKGEELFISYIGTNVPYWLRRVLFDNYLLIQ
jgi:hypothetical protein